MMVRKKNKKAKNAADNASPQSARGTTSLKGLRPEAKIVKKVPGEKSPGPRKGKDKQQSAKGDDKRKTSLSTKESNLNGEVSEKGKNQAEGDSDKKIVNEKEEEQRDSALDGKNEGARDERDGGKGKVPVSLENKKESNSKKGEEPKGRNLDSDDKLGGMIFMCNTRTKPDCFRYQVMAVPLNNRETVLRIRPGVKLFLYDFDQKLMHGIYESSSSGALKLEPTAFGGAFPAQVRFKVYKECEPLPESVFKKAIIENYDERGRRFKTELSSLQVKKLSVLFQPVRHADRKRQIGDDKPLPSPRSKHPKSPVVAPGDERPMHKVVSHPNPLFLTEEQYRNFGIRPELRGANAIMDPSPPYRSSQEKYLFYEDSAHTRADISSIQDTASGASRFFLTEEEYRTYGLRGRREQASSIASTRPLTNGLVDLRDDHYPLFGYSANSNDPYLWLHGTSGAPCSSSLNPGADTYHNEMRYDVSQGPDFHLQRRHLHDGQYSGHLADRLSEHNTSNLSVVGQPQHATLPVSSRYSFAGASMSYR